MYFLPIPLPVIESSEPNKLVWVGINDRAILNTWVITSTGEPAIYMNWNTGEPNGNVLNDEDCVMMAHANVRGKWYDVDCDVNNKFVICEREV